MKNNDDNKIILCRAYGCVIINNGSLDIMESVGIGQITGEHNVDIKLLLMILFSIIS